MRSWIKDAAYAVMVALVTLLGVAAPMPASAQDRTALARLAGPPVLSTGWRSVTLQVPLTQPVAWRTRLLSDPPRAVVDFNTVDWAGFDPDSVALSGAVTALRVGHAGSGWSRLVIELSRPMGFASAEMRTTGDLVAPRPDATPDATPDASADAASGASTGATSGSTPDATGGTQAAPNGSAELSNTVPGALVSLRLEPLSPEAFAAQAATLDQGQSGIPAHALIGGDGAIALGQRPTIVVLDPGHGGVDPGASYQGLTEANIMLTFARELADALRRTGRYEVVMTRDTDAFISLEARITVAHSARADVFLSLHADALEGQQARGATLYTLAEEASDEASAALAQRHDRDDLMGGGVDLTGTDDVVASVLMSLARAETAPSTDRLARALVAAIEGREIRMHRHPWQQAAFSVLKSPSVPSVLLEVGFLSNTTDRNRLRDLRWRAQMVQALIDGLDAWVEDEATRAALRRH